MASRTLSFQVGTSLLLELAQDVLDEGNVKMFTTKMGITIGGLDFEDTLLHLQMDISKDPPPRS